MTQCGSAFSCWDQIWRPVPDRQIYIPCQHHYNRGWYKGGHSRLSKARSVFRNMNNIWRSAHYNTSTILKLYQSCVVSTNFGESHGQTSPNYDHSIRNACTEYIEFSDQIFWPEKIPYEESLSRCNQEDLWIIKKRRWRWKILRKDRQSTTRTALHIIQKAREKQEHHGEGQWRASLKPCSRLRDK